MATRHPFIHLHAYTLITLNAGLSSYTNRNIESMQLNQNVTIQNVNKIECEYKVFSLWWRMTYPKGSDRLVKYQFIEQRLVENKLIE